MHRVAPGGWRDGTITNETGAGPRHVPIYVVWEANLFFPFCLQRPQRQPTSVSVPKPDSALPASRPHVPV